jgi:hypothetical protein
MALKEITFPLTVDKIQFSKTPAFLDKCVLGGKCGDFVAVRPCAGEYQGKTYLGILLGEIAESTLVQYDDARVLRIEPSLHNPIIFIPDLLTVVRGYESWFKRIRSKEDLSVITNQDIQNVWYVRALKSLQEN